MTDRIAIKRLTASDCTLFESIFRKSKVGNQKSINLNADVLIGNLYPNLPVLVGASDNEVALAISIYGPDGKPAHNLSRKIIKNLSYKNWRLDGEFIYGPPDDPSRYDDLKAGDLAVMVFRGEAVPTGMSMILIKQSSADDQALHSALSQLLGNRSMVAVTAAQIIACSSVSGVSATHPIHIAAVDRETESALEDAAQGGVTGIGKLLRNKVNRKISGLDLAKAKAKAELTGHDGEGLVNGWLAAKSAAGQLQSYVWESLENAIAPYDFDIVNQAGERLLIDVKTTSGPFENAIHISLAEIIEASGSVPYMIYRVFEIDDNGANLCISKDIRDLARSLKKVHETYVPDGIRIDSFSVSPSSLQWGQTQYITRTDDEFSA
jgi:hypothetical protein